LTAKRDIFSREEVAALWGTVAERDGQIAGLNKAVAERPHILSSTSWRITRPLRIVGDQFKRSRHFVELARHAIQLGVSLKNALKKAINLCWYRLKI
jgi:hypothetical protein